MYRKRGRIQVRETVMNEPRDLDDLLTHAAPRDIVVTPAIEDELARMTIAARTDHGRHSRGRRHLSRAATVGISTAIVLATAGAAAAAAFGPWYSGWAEDPVATITYTVPSGDTCERRIGAIAGADPDMRVAVQDFLPHPTSLTSSISMPRFAPFARTPTRQ
jgi:hypothetical protein